MWLAVRTSNRLDFSRMSDTGLILLFAGIALVVAWFVNALVSTLSGEHPGDTGSLWWDVFSRMLGGWELGFLGWVLNNLNGSWVRRIFGVLGLIALVIFVVKGCRRK